MRRMAPLPLANIRMTDQFWSRWQRVLVETTLPSQYGQLVSTGRLENFRRAGKREQGGFQGLYFNDSDVYKYLEACAYGLCAHESTAVRGQMNEVIALVEAAQEADGYINTFFQLMHPDLKWRNLNSLHEMYCGGHLIEAAVAIYECLGERKLLDVAIRFADHVASVFGPGKRRGYCGHQEIELALIRLSKATGEKKYSDLGSWMIEERGNPPSVFEAELDDAPSLALQPAARHMLKQQGKYSGEYAQDHAPIRQHRAIVGHAVRAMYFYTAAADLADSRHDEPLGEALEEIWNNLTRKRMYVTGGIGPSAHNEGFTRDFDLPNLTAYAETCAAVGLILWGRTLLELTGDSEYADVIERALYNGAMSGISLSGDLYFYTNPLESRGNHERTPWFECACCPPNIARLIGSVGWVVASGADDGFWIHIPAGFDADLQIHGVPVKIRSVSNYPDSGKIEVTVEVPTPVRFNLRVRIPHWADEATFELVGDGHEAEYEGGYACFDLEWKGSTTLKIDLPMTPKWVEADPRVRDDLGRAALVRGPLVYACEEKDAGFAPQLFVVDTDIEPEERQEPMLEGVVSIVASGVREEDGSTGELYAELGASRTFDAQAEFIPYYAWCNRGPNNMQVWMRHF